MPAGWVQCFGQHYESKDMPALANVCGGYWYYLANPVAGFPSNFTFGVPNLAGRAPVGWDNTTNGGAGYYVGLLGGLASATLTIANMPAHDHGWSQPAHGHPGSTIADHTHPYTGVAAGSGLTPGGGNLQLGGLTTGGSGATAATIAAASANISFTGQGSGTGHENRQPFAVVNFLIRFA